MKGRCKHKLMNEMMMTEMRVNFLILFDREKC